MTFNEFRQYKNQYENSLAHHGIEGQKWGVRRWQNPDGTYTEEGKERYFGSGKKNTGAKSNTKEYLKFRNKMLKEKTRPDLADWYKENHKAQDKQMLKDAKKIDKQANKMRKNQLKDFYDDPNELVADIDRVYKISGHQNDNKTIDDIKIGAYGSKTSDDPDNKYQNKDGSLTEKGYKKFISKGGFWSPDIDPIGGNILFPYSDRVKKSINLKKYHEAEVKKRANIVNDILADDSIDPKKKLKEDVYNKTARRRLAELIDWCKKNGKTSVTEEDIEGNHAGNEYLVRQRDYIRNAEYGQPYAAGLVKSMQRLDVWGDPNVQKFKDNSKEYKSYKENHAKALAKYDDVCQREFIKLVQKELGHKVKVKYKDNEYKTPYIDLSAYEKDEALKKAVNNNFMAAAQKGGSNEEVKKLYWQGYKDLQKCEVKANEFAQKYLNCNADKKVPGTYQINTLTGEAGQQSLSSAYAYTMLAYEFAPYDKALNRGENKEEKK